MCYELGKDEAAFDFLWIAIIMSKTFELFKRRSFVKEHQNDLIWWVVDDDEGEIEFSFDKRHIYELFKDYPWKLTPEEKEIFDRENPFWADFFNDRVYKVNK